VTERSSSGTGKFERDSLAEDNHGDEKRDGPNVLESPSEGSVGEPDLKRLLRSEPTKVWSISGGAINEVMECLIVGRLGATRLGGVLALCLCSLVERCQVVQDFVLGYAGSLGWCGMICSLS